VIGDAHTVGGSSSSRPTCLLRAATAPVAPAARAAAELPVTAARTSGPLSTKPADATGAMGQNEYSMRSGDRQLLVGLPVECHDSGGENTCDE
jgi:hypothetical protein